MRKYLSFAVITALFVAIFFSCKPEEPDNRTACQKKNVGYMAFQNKSNDAYDIFINNEYFKQQPGNSYMQQYAEFPAGRAYVIKVQQVSGYILYPTVKTYNVTLNQCDQKNIVFP